jgi:hypothetical protein
LRIFLLSYRPLQYIIWHVSRVVANCPSVRVREDDWGPRDVEHVSHGCRGHVGEVDQHPQPVHLGHDLSSKVREAVAAYGEVARVDLSAVDPDVIKIVAVNSNYNLVLIAIDHLKKYFYFYLSFCSHVFTYIILGNYHTKVYCRRVSASGIWRRGCTSF